MPWTMFILFSTLCRWTLPHLVHPVNYCYLAGTCEHDNSPVCGSEGCDKRSFLDVCDMYEYNCDYGKRFQKIIEGCTPTTTVTSQMNTTVETTEVFTTEITETNTTPEETTEDAPTTEVTETDVEDVDVTDREQLIERKEKTTNHIFSKCCGPKKSWLTTARGETRDFFRILKGKGHK